MPDRWDRTEAVLGAALQAPPDERADVLDRLCDNDLELRREVESLLAAHEESEGFLATSAESFAAPFVVAAAARESGDRPGDIVGRYRLIEEIGRGGMGTVWLAERADGEFEQKVALKLIKRGMDSDEILARFLRERQILARLEHPNIAHLLDGGVNHDGRPYFAMELVTGNAITDYCDELKLGIDERLRLFIVVARAVGYAHRNLVVHRDIKPSNVLVDRDGTIKLLDFGIAKVLDEPTDHHGATTRPMARLMTTEYASPEQIAGKQVTTASDVYQLGLLLYELLTSRPPYSAERQTGSQFRRPSSFVRLHSSDNSYKRLYRRLRGDLDTIVLRALREEPERRYPSAQDLAEDVERHLAKLPIRFGGDSARYRAAKFFQRHRLGVMSAAGIIALIVGVTAFDAAQVRRERDRARHEADKATETTQLMARFLQGWSPDASDRGEVSAKKLLGEAALRAQRELANRPEMLAATLSILGDFHTTLGEWRTADSLLARAQRMQERRNNSPDADLAATIARRGRLYRLTGRTQQGITATEQSLSLHRSLFGARHSETLRIQRELAAGLRDTKQYKECELQLRDILTKMEQTGGPKSPFALEVASDLGYALFQQGRFDESIAILRPTLANQRALFGDVHSATLTTTRSLGSALRDRGDLDEAEALYRDALRISRALYGNRHSETEGALLILAILMERKNNLEEAESLEQQALAVSLAVNGPNHPGVWGHRGHLGVIRLDRGDTAVAERLLRETLAKSRAISRNRDPDEGDLLNRLAFILVKRHAPDADRMYREAVAFDDSRPPGSPDFVSDGIHFLAETERERGDLDAAEIDYRRALRMYERQLPLNHPYRIAATTGLAEVLRAKSAR